MDTIQITTEFGSCIPALTGEQMREVDRIAITATGPSLFQMMERAGQSLYLLTRKLLGARWKRSRILILAGNGGNGGGGICAARYLIRRGVDARVALAREADRPEVINFQLGRYRANSGRVELFKEVRDFVPDLVIDALIGYGARGRPSGRVAEMIEWTGKLESLVVSLDIPSGMNATTGTAEGLVVKPDVTLTLALPKTGLIHARTEPLFLADIGIRVSTYQRLQIQYEDPFDGLPYIELRQSASSCRLEKLNVQKGDPL